MAQGAGDTGRLWEEPTAGLPVPSQGSMGIQWPAASRGLGPAIATPTRSLGTFSNLPSSLHFTRTSNFIRKLRTKDRRSGRGSRETKTD